VASSAEIQALRDEMNRLRGHLFGAVEATGMATKQEAAFKGLIREFTYAAQTNLEAAMRRNGNAR